MLGKSENNFLAVIDLERVNEEDNFWSNCGTSVDRHINFGI
jgi:hypothetical protein